MAEWRRVILSPARLKAYLEQMPESTMSNLCRGVQFVGDPLVPENRGFALDEHGNVVAVFKFGNDDEVSDG